MTFEWKIFTKKTVKILHSGARDFRASKVSRQPRFGVLADFAPRQVWPRHRYFGLAVSGGLQIGLACRFFLWAD